MQYLFSFFSNAGRSYKITFLVGNNGNNLMENLFNVAKEHIKNGHLLDTTHKQIAFRS